MVAEPDKNAPKLLLLITGTRRSWAINFDGIFRPNASKSRVHLVLRVSAIIFFIIPIYECLNFNDVFKHYVDILNIFFVSCSCKMSVLRFKVKFELVFKV